MAAMPTVPVKGTPEFNEQFGVFVDHWRPWMEGVAKTVAPGSDPEDVVSEVVATLYRNFTFDASQMNTGRVEWLLKGWLRRAVRNKVIDHSARKRCAPLSTLEGSDELPGPMPEPTLFPCRQRQVDRAIARIPLHVLKLFYLARLRGICEEGKKNMTVKDALKAVRAEWECKLAEGQIAVLPRELFDLSTAHYVCNQARLAYERAFLAEGIQFDTSDPRTVGKAILRRLQENPTLHQSEDDSERSAPVVERSPE